MSILDKENIILLIEEYLQTVNAKYHTGNHTQKWLNKEFSKANADEFMDKVFRTDITRLIAYP
jgi:asparagine synthase (glutamine-hydrolysing)